MKRRNFFPLLAFLIVAAIAVATQPSSAFVQDQGPSATGQGEFDFFNGIATEHWSYSFEALTNKNGHVRGRATFDILENFTQTQVVVKINCLSVAGPTGAATAVMSGTVLHSDDPEFPKRSNVIFAVDDNSAFFPVLRPDHITLLSVFEGDCHTGVFPLTVFAQPPDAIHIEQ